MSLDPKAKAALALHRFGLGPRLGSIAGIASDPQGALIADMERNTAARVTGYDLPRSDAAMRADFQDRQERKQERLEQARAEGKAIAARKRARAAPQSDTGSMAASDADPMKESADAMKESNARPERRAERRVTAQIYLDESEARTAMALAADTGVAERLVWFWSNHFCVSARKGPVRPIAGAFEREAIRPHVLGRFVDMLLAVESHPAMLIYLDNARSFGPNSRVGRNSGRGLNENLAREILELHTLGVRSVYSQQDVTSFAKVLTGWTVVGPRRDNARGGQFEFSPDRHEPGPHTVVGKSYADTGFEQGRAVLTDVARHPATARHVATKLATHFVADAPPQSLVDRLAKRFLETEGNLKEVSRALLQSDEAWNAPRSKLKRPSEWIVGAMRAVGASAQNRRLVNEAQNMLGEPLWRAPSPRGFSDQSAEWIDGLAERLDVASFLSRRLAPPGDPMAVLEQTLGPLASEKTRSTIARAEDRTQALTLLFMAPEFQLR